MLLMSSNALLADDAPGAGEAGFPFTFQLLFDIGFGYAHNDDMNRDMKAAASFRRDELNASKGYSAYGIKQKNDANLNLGFNIELRYFFDRLGFGVSWGAYRSEAEYQITPNDNIYARTFSDTLIAMPVTATVYYRSRLSRRTCFILGLGGGYYPIEMTRELKETYLLLFYKSNTQVYKGHTGGVHAKIELSFHFGVFTLYTGILGRYVPICSLENRDGVARSARDGSKMEFSLSGALWYFGAGLSF